MNSSLHTLSDKGPTRLTQRTDLISALEKELTQLNKDRDLVSWM